MLFDHKGLSGFYSHCTQTFQPLGGGGTATARYHPIGGAKVADGAFGKKEEKSSFSFGLGYGLQLLKI